MADNASWIFPLVMASVWFLALAVVVAALVGSGSQKRSSTAHCELCKTYPLPGCTQKPTPRPERKDPQP